MAIPLILTILASSQLALSQKVTPFCLQTCLTEAQTTLCAPSALSVLTPCLVRVCPNPPATQNLIASLDVTISPKAEYSCQQSYGPSEASENEGSAVTLPLNGSCTNSPYGFKSFVAQGVSRIRASNGCRVMVFSDEDCLGETGGSDVGPMSSGQCVFRGGRSARLTCRNELDAARAYIQSSCGASSEDDDEDDNTSSDATSTSVYPSSAPYHGPGPTSSGTGTSSSVPFHWPFSSTGDTATNTADATGSGRPDQTTHTITLPSQSSDSPTGITHTVTLPPVSGNITGPSTSYSNSSTNTPSQSSPSSPPQNSTQFPISLPTAQNATHSVTLFGTPTAPATATAFAARFDAQSGVLLGLVGFIAALFL